MPISKHRLFPALVALWFGALFGLSIMAVRPGLLETLVVSAQFDRLIPAAAPPLGDTARILTALIMAALGALLGAVIGTRIARPGLAASQREPAVSQREDYTNLIEDKLDQRPQDVHAVAPEGQVFSVDQETGPETGDALSGLAHRRRSLSLPEHEDRDEYPELTLLPSSGPQIFNIAEINFATPMAAEAPLDHGSFEDAPVAEEAAPVTEYFAPTVLEDTVNAVATTAAEDDAAQPGDIEPLDMVSLAERLVQSMEHRRGRADAGVAVTETEAARDPEVWLAPMALPDAMRPISIDYGRDDELDASAPLTQATDSEALAEVTADVLEDEDAEAIDEDSGYSSLLNLSRAPERRHSFARIEDEPTAEELAAEPIVIFPGQAVRAAAIAGPLQGPADHPASPMQISSETESGEDAEVVEAGNVTAGVSSIAPAGLRRFGTPASPEQEQPTTRDQDQTVQDSADTERALRDALVSLQRMTGTA